MKDVSVPAAFLDLEPVCHKKLYQGRLRRVPKGGLSAELLDVEKHVKDVAVVDDVALALLADPAAFLGGGLAAGFE